MADFIFILVPLFVYSCFYYSWTVFRYYSFVSWVSVLVNLMLLAFPPEPG